jgi:hypothetical protein
LILRPSFVAGLSLEGNGMKAPSLHTGLGVERHDAPAQAEVAVGHAANDEAIDVGGRRGDLLAFEGRIVADAARPDLFAGVFLDRDHARARHADEHQPLAHGHALGGDSALGRLKGPQNLAGFWVQGVERLARGHEHAAVGDDS